MSEPKGLANKYLRLFLFLIVVAAVVFIVVRNIGVGGNILLVILGFGAVVLVHEFGHFIVAKMSGIKVEAFSIGFSPVLLGILRTENGYRIRVLPGFFPVDEEDDSDGSLLTLTIGRRGKAGETEYRIGLIPFGGFVKMLGQEDTKAAGATDDPRSFANKGVAVRAAVIVAGVTFNAISAIIIFMVAFLIGIKLTPTIVGGVIPNSPAAVAGLQAGDEIIEIEGEKKNLDFSNIGIAAALSDVNQPVEMTVKKKDGTTKELSLTARIIAGSETKVFGILPPASLDIAKVSDINSLAKSTGLMPGDRVKAVNGKDIQAYWDLEEVVENTLAPTVTMLAERTPKKGKMQLVEAKIPLGLEFAGSYDVNSESQLYNICSMVPRLRITAVESAAPGWLDKLLIKMHLKKNAAVKKPVLKVNDIILAVDDVENPTYVELRATTEKFKGKELTFKVLRKNADGTEIETPVTVVPEYSKEMKRVMIGIGVVLDAEHPVVAKTVSTKEMLAKLGIPRGAAITAVDGVKVSNFYDIIREVRRKNGQRITIDYRLNAETAGDVVLNMTNGKDLITAKSTFAEFVPFANLKNLYKASGRSNAISMGCKKTVMFIVQTYITLKQLLSGLISPKLLVGPVGIISLSYRIVSEQPTLQDKLIYYSYFLGLISACIAVMNLLPLLPFDGGVLVMLAVEKIKGSAISERIQGMLAYAGLILIGAFFIYVTFNDIVRSFFTK